MVLLLWIIFVVFRVCCAFLSAHCGLVVTCWERAGLLALLSVVFYCVFVTFACGVLGQVWYFIVLIPDLCLLTNFDALHPRHQFFSHMERISCLPGLIQY